MTAKNSFPSLEDQQDSIENNLTKRNRYLAGKARPIINPLAAAREDAEEQGIDIEEMERIDIEEMDRIDRGIDRQALLNMASQHSPHHVKQEAED